MNDPSAEPNRDYYRERYQPEDTDQVVDQPVRPQYEEDFDETITAGIETIN